ncbi:sensor protein KdpD [compost metagenome]
MGLGLTISQTIIESIGGRLAARNLETGGAEFSLTVPVLKNSHPDAKEEQQ